MSRNAFFALSALYFLCLLNIIQSPSVSSAFQQFLCISIIFIAYSASVSINAIAGVRTPFHAPWMYFPLIVALYFFVEPTLRISNLTAQDPARVSWYCTAFLLAFLTGCTLMRPASAMLLRKGASQFRISEKRLLIAAFLMLASSAMVAWYVISTLGFLPIRSDFDTVRTSLNEYIGGYLLFILYLATPAGILFLFVRAKTERRDFKLLALIGGILAFLLPLLIGSRTRALLILIVPLLAKWSRPGGRPSATNLLMWGLAAVFIMGAVGAVRIGHYMNGSFLDLSLFKLSQEIGLGPYTVDFLMKHIGENSYLSLSWLFSPLQAILPGHDLTIVNYLKKSQHMQFIGGGFTPTIVGSFYIYGGIAAVLIGGAFYGALQTWIYRWYMSDVSSEARYWKGILYFLNVVLAGAAVKNGFFISVEPLFYFVCLGVALWYARGRIRYVRIVRRPENVPLARQRFARG